MSIKTLHSSNNSARVPTVKRLALRRIHVACSIALLALSPIAATALELGDAAIRSGIGESLLVEIPYRVSPGEQLTSACVSLAPARRPDALPTYSRASRVTVGPTHIEIFGNSRVLEPAIGLIVDVHCATVPRFVRSYELFVDPPARMPAILSNARPAAARVERALETTIAIAERQPDARRADASAPAAATNRQPPSTEAIATRPIVSARARGQMGDRLTQGQAYVVVRGDTLSGIAARVGDRRVTIAEAAEAIFAANPQAFARGNRDLLEAGRTITIPVMTAANSSSPGISATVEPAALAADEQVADTPLPTTDVAPGLTRESAPSTEAAATVVVRESVELPVPVVASPTPTAAPTARPNDVEPSSASLATTPATTVRASGWLTALLALGAVVMVSASLLLLRRRKLAAMPADAAKIRSSHPRRLVDPTAGFDVVEAELPRARTRDEAPRNHDKAAFVTPATTPAAQLDAATLNIGPVSSVDLDVGMPVVDDERVDMFPDHRDTAPTAALPITASSIEQAATVQMRELNSTASLRQQPLEANDAASDAMIDDVQHTLTIIELDMLRQDYEAEHTLTQAGSKALQDAVADLKATQAALAATADTATMEMPETPAEPIEAQPTQKLRSAR